MKKLVLALVLVGLLVAAPAFAEHTYQVTGNVLEVTDAAIVVKSVKDKTKWELKKDANTKVTGDLEVGAKVMIEYTMTATNIEVKKPAKKK